MTGLIKLWTPRSRPGDVIDFGSDLIERNAPARCEKRRVAGLR